MITIDWIKMGWTEFYHINDRDSEGKAIKGVLYGTPAYHGPSNGFEISVFVKRINQGNGIAGEMCHITTANARDWSPIDPTTPRPMPETCPLLEQDNIRMGAYFAPVDEAPDIRFGEAGVWGRRLIIYSNHLIKPESIYVELVRIRNTPFGKRVGIESVSCSYSPEDSDKDTRHQIKLVMLGRMPPAILADRIEEVEPPTKPHEILILDILRKTDPATRTLEV